MNARHWVFAAVTALGAGIGANLGGCLVCPEPEVYTLELEEGEYGFSPQLSQLDALAADDVRLRVGTEPMRVEVEFLSRIDGGRYRVELGVIDRDWVTQP